MRFVITLALLAASVHAGLEDAKHSVKLTGANFDSQIQAADKGALVAFYAPWCGHCGLPRSGFALWLLLTCNRCFTGKNLAPAWDKVAKDFENEEGCIVAHLDADEQANKPIANRYGVSGYPTLKFFPGKGQAPLDYRQGRSESDLRKYLNEMCGTDRQPGGLLGANAGRIPGLDDIAQQYLGTPLSDRTNLLESAKAIANTVTGGSASYYLKVMEKLDTAGAVDYIQTELARLQKLADRKGAVAGRKLDELQLRQNILRAFESLKGSAEEIQDSVKSVLGEAAEAAAQATDRIKEEL